MTDVFASDTVSEDEIQSLSPDRGEAETVEGSEAPTKLKHGFSYVLVDNPSQAFKKRW